MNNLAALLIAALGLSSIANAQETPVPRPSEPIKLITSNRGIATYADTCSNGKNAADTQTVSDFLALMEKDINSKLYKLELRAKAEAHAELPDYPIVYVWVSNVTTASHVRVGCASSDDKLIALVQTAVGPNNSHDVKTHFIVVIKDVVDGGVRTLELVSAHPEKLKSE